LDVGRIEDACIRLVETKENVKDPYIALSYCWGRSTTVRTVQANMDRMMTGIETTELPKTLQDAVFLTRTLGIRYLWIDALCIIQDLPSDWKREAAKMASVYEGAFLTIAASSAAAADQGFLTERPVWNSIPFAWTGEGSQPRTIQARVEPYSGLHNGLDDPWSLRGWTFQEQVLANRLISFSTHELQWMCKTTATCECGAIDEATLSTDEFSYLRISQMSTSLEAFACWQSLVATYSERTLTFGSDKLPAISGLAVVVQRFTESTYVAGLWADNIVLDLCWQRYTKTADVLGAEATDAVKVFTPTYRAPTFSWASIDALVGYANFTTLEEWDRWVPLTNVVDIQTAVSGENPYGSVAGASLSLRGPVIDVRVQAKEETDNPRLGWTVAYHVEICQQTYQFEADVGVQQFFVSHGPSSGLSSDLPVACRADYDFRPLTQQHSRCPPNFDSGSLIKDARAWALYMGYVVRNTEAEATRHVFLILGRSKHQPSMYERIGFLPVWFDGCEKCPDYVGHGSVNTITII